MRHKRTKRTAASIQPINEISNTPLIDISMLLLVTFLITYPLMENAVHVNLPKGKADEVQIQQSRNITLKLTGEILLDDRIITPIELESAMLGLRQQMPDATVFVRADKDLKYECVMDVMRILHAANVTRVALVTQVD